MYTRPGGAFRCLHFLEDVFPSYADVDVILDPNVGDGAFFKMLPKDKRLGIDACPTIDGVKDISFLHEFSPELGKTYAVIGTPPFNRSNKEAIRFFNKAAEFAEVIAFIVPRNFNRITVQNMLSLDMHLQYSVNLTLKKEYFHPSLKKRVCFQVWIRQTVPRKQVPMPEFHKDFVFLSVNRTSREKVKPEHAQIVVSAFSVDNKKIFFRPENLKRIKFPGAWHWICTVPGGPSVEELVSRFKMMDFSIGRESARHNSFDKKYFVYEYKKVLERLHSEDSERDKALERLHREISEHEKALGRLRREIAGW